MRRSWTVVTFIAAPSIGIFLGSGCSGWAPSDCASNSNCSPMPDSGNSDTSSPKDATVVDAPTSHDAGDGQAIDAPQDAANDVPVDSWVCPATAEPKDQPCVIDDTLAVFVSASATAGGQGTKASPLQTIDAGISLAKTASKRVYVCGGSYDEKLTIDSSRDGVKVFGGFRCSDWTYTGEKPVVAPSTRGVVLTLTSLTSALFVDIEFDAQPAGAAGESSVTAFVNGSSNVEFRRTKIAAGAAEDGPQGVLTPFTFPAVTDLKGNAGNGAAGGSAKTYTACPGGGSTTGGKGGDSPTGAGDPGLPALGMGTGGTTQACVTGTNGGNGAAGVAASNSVGAAFLGVLNASGWQPAAGAQGNSGGVGQGGGGGGAVSPGGGGSGGAGACGGAGGGGGGGGGGSVAVLAFNAPGLAFTASTLSSAKAGNGGSGVNGQPGMSQGGNGGLPDSNGGCAGGRGGSGGAGGAGGGGAGGVSAGVLYKGAAPNLDAASSAASQAGQHGTKGAGGAPGLNDGIDGQSGITVAAP